MVDKFEVKDQNDDDDEHEDDSSYDEPLFVHSGDITINNTSWSMNLVLRTGVSSFVLYRKHGQLRSQLDLTKGRYG